MEEFVVGLRARSRSEKREYGGGQDGKIFEMPLSYVDYFILNEIEAGQILGRPGAKAGEGEELAAQLAEKFPGAKIVLTLGGEGSVYTDGSRLYRQSIYRTKTVDTTAAGDTFTGYFIAGILTGCSVEDSMDLAARAAAITVSGEGAAPSIPDMKTVKERVFLMGNVGNFIFLIGRNCSLPPLLCGTSK